jgi:hypothetical protein
MPDNIWEGGQEPEPAPAAEPETTTQQTEQEPPQATGDQPETTPAPAAPPVESTASAWTPEKVAEIIRASRETGPGEPAAPQMSQEEMDRMLNVINVSPEDFQAIVGGGESALDTFNKIIQGAVLQARTTAWYQSQILMRQLQQQMAPVMDYYQRAQQDKLTEQFFNENKDFLPEKHTKLLAAVKTSLDAEGAFRGKTQAEGFKLIVERAKEVLSASGTPLVPVASTTNGGRGMAQLSRGAGHGAAAEVAGAAPSASATAKRFFGG